MYNNYVKLINKYNKIIYLIYFAKLGPLRNMEISLLIGFLSAVGLIVILSTCLSMYGTVSFGQEDLKDPLYTSKGWSQFTAGFFVGAIGGAGFAYLLLVNLPIFK